MNESRKIIKAVVAVLLAAIMLVSSPQGIVRAAENVDKVSISLIGKYDSADTAAIRSIDTAKKKIRLRNHDTGKTYTLSYDNTSMMYDARGTVLSASLLEVGQIVDVTFLKSSKHITTLNISKDAWTVEDTRSHELVRGDGTARVLGDIYKIDSRTLVMAEGDLALAEDVLATDTITVSGVGKDIYSVIVTGGHGYVSLSSETVEDHSLVGAWLELDNEVIHKISPNMMLSAPEGDYNLQILGNGASFQTPVNISRNQETVVDTSNVVIEKPKESLVTFEIVPDYADVFVDGERVLTGVSQSIRYGYHSLKVMADGYVTQDKYLKVGTPSAVIAIELEAESASTSDTVSTSSVGDIGSISNSSTEGISVGVSTGDVSDIVNSNAISSAASTASTADESTEKEGTNKVIEGYKIYFDSPYEAELYFDGDYIGVIPTNVTKISGTHEVILKKDGYETKSYRINVDKEKDDKSYTFPDLVEVEDEEGSSSSSASSSASTSDGSSAASSASTGDSSDSGASSSASTGSSADSSEAASSASAASASSSEDGSTSASTQDSSTSASTQDGSTSASTQDSGASASTQDSAAGKDTSSGEASTASSAAVEASSETSTPSEPASDASTEVASIEENSNSEASDAASTASGE